MAVEPLLTPLLGTWFGSGNGELPGMDPFSYEEEVRFLDAGTRDLVYLQRAWDPDSLATLHAEAGTWRAMPDGVMAVTVALPRAAEVSEGTIQGGIISLASTSVGRAPNAAPLVATRRRYHLAGDELTYAVEITTLAVPHSTSHLAGSLRRVADPPPLA